MSRTGEADMAGTAIMVDMAPATSKLRVRMRPIATPGVRFCVRMSTQKYTEIRGRKSPQHVEV